MTQTFKCRNCGAELDIRRAIDGVAECEYCFSANAVPKDDTPAEVKQYLQYGKANLDIGEFGRAYAYYQKAAELSPKEPEAYFGMALAEFGVQYLQYIGDDGQKRSQAICHSIDERIFSDSNNYLKAYKYGTLKQKDLYEKQAEEIDYIRKEFYKLERTGLTYDCFICVKVTDPETGGRTADYKIADDLYYALRRKGYRPFFSENELQDVTGADYEARILYALVMSECMLIVCSNEDYLKTKWVKNEYTRFLRLLNDEQKESDSIAIVYKNKAIERLEGKNGRIQGIDIAKMGSFEKVLAFVESHTPEARKQREEAAAAKNRENEELKRKLAALEAKLAGQSDAMSDDDLLERMERARAAREQKEKAESERLAREAAEKKRLEQEEAEKRAKEAAERGVVEADFESNADIEDGILWAYTGQATEVAVPEGITVIGDSAFSECEHLRHITLPDSLQKIDDEAFCNCYDLVALNIPASVTSIGQDIFSNCEKLESITVAKGNKKYHSKDNCIIETATKTLIAGCKNSIIPADGSVNIIGDSAFACCWHLKSITVPEGVTRIGQEAFYECTELTTVTLSTGLTTIDDGAFGGCYKLSAVDIPDTVTQIGKNVFGDCNELKTARLSKRLTSIDDYMFNRCRSLTAVTIPASVTSIGNGVFGYCDNLQKITIPDSVTSIGNSAFVSCKNLTEIEFLGSESQWKAIKKGADWDTNTGEYKVNCKKW